jgi:hypothetical protein
MDEEQRNEAAHDLAGICARGFDKFAAARGLSDSAAERTPDGKRYAITDSVTRGSTGFVKFLGEQFAINVIPLANWKPQRPPSWDSQSPGYAATDEADEAAGCST